MARAKARCEPLQVFVGTSPNGQDEEACDVLEASLRRHASVPVAITWLYASPDKGSRLHGWRSEQWVTPWTAFRWAVPELCGRRGRAIYFDCPTLVLGDVAELAEVPFPDEAVLLAHRAGRTLSTACLVFDCARAAKLLPTIAVMRRDVGAHQTVGDLLDRYARSVGLLPDGWGLSDSEFSARPPSFPAKSVHFARPHTQPHIPLARARLARSGRHHWFREVTLPHYCSRLVSMFEEYSQPTLASDDAEAAG